MTQQILGLRAENYKRVELVNIEFPPGGGVFAVMGDNEAGKTSLLDALETCIAGKRMPKSDVPVNIPSGADKARIIATFDDIVVTRVFSKGGGTTITVKNADGVPVAEAAKLMEKLYSHVALDPLAFSRLSDVDQVNTLLPLIGYDPAPIAAERKAVFEERTARNRDLAGVRARAAGFPDPEPGLPKEEVSISALTEELSSMEQRNAARRELDRYVEGLQEEFEKASTVAERVRAELAAAEAELAAVQDRLVQGQDALATALDAVDTSPIRERIANAEGTNAKVRAEAARQAITAEVREVEEAVTKLNADIEAIDTRKTKALTEAASKMPVPGLSIEGDEEPILALNGIPFSQASTGVKIKTGTAIAMALNPALRLIIIRDASLLDQGNRDVIDQLALDNGFLVLMEIADESSPIGVVIEEGAVREVRTAGEWEAAQ